MKRTLRVLSIWAAPLLLLALFAPIGCGSGGGGGGAGGPGPTPGGGSQPPENLWGAVRIGNDSVGSILDCIACDLDNDGDLDIIVAVADDDGTAAGMPHGTVLIMQNDGTPFTNAEWTRVDMDGDPSGLLGAGGIGTLPSFDLDPGAGDGPAVPAGASVNAVFCCDVDCDGDMDIAFALDTGHVYLLENPQNDGAAAGDPFTTDWIKSVEITTTDANAVVSAAGANATAINDIHMADLGDSSGNTIAFDGFCDLIIGRDEDAGNAVTEVVVYENPGDLGTDPFDIAGGNTWDAVEVNGGATLSEDVNSVDTADMDGDGDLDIVSGDAGGAVEGFRNDRDMTFTQGGAALASASGGSGDEVTEVHVADLDLDGRVDVVFLAAGGTGNNVRIAQNDGTPFAAGINAAITINSTATPVCIGVGNVDDDIGLNDAPTDPDGATDTDALPDVFLATVNTVTVRTRAWRLITEDQDPFGDADGSADWAAHEIREYPGTPVACCSGDLDMDGRDDLIVTATTPEVRIFENDAGNNTLSFNASSTLNATGTGEGFAILAVGDLDGDGDTDVVALTDDAADSGGATGSGNGPQIVVFENPQVRPGSDIPANEVDPFTTAWTRTVITDGSDADHTIVAGGEAHVGTDIQLCDLDNDGDLDIVFTVEDRLDTDTGRLFVWENLLDTGADPFTVAGWDDLITIDTDATRDNFAALEVKDVDCDGDCDIVYGRWDQSGGVANSEVVVIYNPVTQGGDAFTAADWIGGAAVDKAAETLDTGTTDDIFDVAVGDLDGDGTCDIVVVLEDPTTAATTETMIALFDQASDTYAGGAGLTNVGDNNDEDTTAVVLGDLDGDGDLEIWITHGAFVGDSSTPDIFEGNGDGTFAAGINPTGGTFLGTAVRMALFDGDLDGDLDEADAQSRAGGGSGAAAVRPNPGKAVALNGSNWTTTILDGASLGLGGPILRNLPADLDLDGDPDLVYGADRGTTLIGDIRVMENSTNAQD